MANMVRCGNTLINIDNVVTVFARGNKIKLYCVHNSVQEIAYETESDAQAAFETLSKECNKKGIWRRLSSQ